MVMVTPLGAAGGWLLPGAGALGAGGAGAAAGTAAAGAAGAAGTAATGAAGAGAAGAAGAAGTAAAGAAAEAAAGGVASALLLPAASTIAATAAVVGIGAITVGAETAGAAVTWDCWKPILHEKSTEPSRGRLLADIMKDPVIEDVRIEPHAVFLRNRWNESWRIDPLILPWGQVAAHASQIESMEVFPSERPVGTATPKNMSADDISDAAHEH